MVSQLGCGSKLYWHTGGGTKLCFRAAVCWVQSQWQGRDVQGIVVTFLVRARHSLLLQSVLAASEAHPDSCSVNIKGSSGVKWPGRDAGHSHPPSPEVKNERKCTSTPPVDSWSAQGQFCLCCYKEDFSGCERLRDRSDIPLRCRTILMRCDTQLYNVWLWALSKQPTARVF